MAVLAIFFVATLIRSAFGFGEALIAVPLLALLLPVEVAAPVAVMVSVTVALVVVAQDWRHVHVRSVGWLLVSTLFGIPVGLWGLKNVPEGVVKGLLGMVILAFGSYSLANRWRGELKNDRLAWFFGFLAGVLGGAYGMNGPPLVVYGISRGWTPAVFRATLQGYFLPASLMDMAGYWMAGLWTAEVSRYYLWSLPAVVPAIFIGRWLNRRLDGRRFLMWVHWGLVGIGAALLWEGWRKGVQ
jgi:uncharacterized membrane protein YfcA